MVHLGGMLPGSRCYRRSAGCGASRCRCGCSETGRGTGSGCRAGRRMASPHTSLHLNCHRIRPWSYSATSLGCTSHLSSGTGPHHSWMPAAYLQTQQILLVSHPGIASTPVTSPIPHPVSSPLMYDSLKPFPVRLSSEWKWIHKWS